MTTYNSDGIPIHNNKINASSAEGMAVYADSSPQPTGDPNGRKGWYFKKTSGAEKFNYYLYAQGNRALRLKDIKEYYFVGSIDTWTDTGSSPFIVIYTKPLGDGNDAPAGWYRTKIVYMINPNASLIQLGVRTQFSTLATTNTRFPYSQKHLALTDIVGVNNPEEEILTMSVQSDSGGTDNTILICHFGYSIHNRNDDVNIALIA